MTNNVVTGKSGNSGLSNDAKTIITILLLVFAFPIGLIYMWVGSSWKVGVKLLITIPIILFTLMAFLLTVNPSLQVKKASCVKSCQNLRQNLEKIGSPYDVCMGKCLDVK